MCPEAQLLEAFQRGFGEALARFILFPIAAFFLGGLPVLFIGWTLKKLLKFDPTENDSLFIVLYISFTLFLIMLGLWIPL